MGCIVAGLTSRNLAAKTASDRINAATRLRPGQSAVAAGEEKAKATTSRAEAKPARAEAPSTDHPDIKPSKPRIAGTKTPLEMALDQNSYLRKRVEHFQKLWNAAKQSKEAAQKDKRQGFKDACTVAAGLRREIQALQGDKKELELKASRLTRDLNASRDENSELRTIIEKLEQAIVLGPGNESQG